MAASVSTRTAGTLNPTRQQLDELDALLQRMLELPVHPLDKAEQAMSEEQAEKSPPPAPTKIERPIAASTPSPREPIEPSRATLPQRPTLQPAMYTVVETASPRPLPVASGFEPRQPTLTPRLVPITPPPPTVPPASVAASSEGEMWVPLRSTWQPSASTWPPLAQSWHQANGSAASVAPPGPIADPHPEPMPPPPEKSAPTEETPLPQPTDEAQLRAPNSEPRSDGTPLLHLSAEDAPVSLPWPLLPLVWFNQGFDACLAPFGSVGQWLSGPGRGLFGFIGLTCLAAAVAVAVSTGMGWSR